MKRKINIVLALTLVLVLVFQVFVSAIGGVEPLNENASEARTSFNITGGGYATVDIYYAGYPNITTGATITTVIQRKVWLFFWEDVLSWVDTPTSESFSTAHHCQFGISGTYKCTVEYVISGTGGTDEVFNFEDTDSY